MTANILFVLTEIANHCWLSLIDRPKGNYAFGAKEAESYSIVRPRYKPYWKWKDGADKIGTVSINIAGKWKMSFHITEIFNILAKMERVMSEGGGKYVKAVFRYDCTDLIDNIKVMPNAPYMASEWRLHGNKITALPVFGELNQKDLRVKMQTRVTHRCYDKHNKEFQLELKKKLEDMKKEQHLGGWFFFFFDFESETETELKEVV